MLRSFAGGYVGQGGISGAKKSSASRPYGGLCEERDDGSDVALRASALDELLGPGGNARLVAVHAPDRRDEHAYDFRRVEALGRCRERGSCGRLGRRELPENAGPDACPQFAFTIRESALARGRERAGEHVRHRRGRLHAPAYGPSRQASAASPRSAAERLDEEVGGELLDGDPLVLGDLVEQRRLELGQRDSERAVGYVRLQVHDRRH